MAEVPRLIPTPLRAATFATMIGLLAATGMRVGEAIALGRVDMDWDEVAGRGASWTGAFGVLKVLETSDELVVVVETKTDVVGCGHCGVRAEAQGRMSNRHPRSGLPRAPARLRWIKRRWRCVCFPVNPDGSSTAAG